MSNQAAEAARRVPLRRTLGQAYRSVLGDLDALIAIAWRWLLIVLPLEIAYQWRSYPAIKALGGGGGLPPEGPVDRLLPIIWGLLLAVPLSAIAVGWHRYVIRGEAPAGSLAATLGGRFQPYLVVALLISLILYLPLATIELIASPTDDDFPLIALLGLAAVLVGAVVTSRLSIVLPAIAVEGPGATLGEAWRLSRGNTWRLLVGYLLATVPVFAVYSLTYSLVEHIPVRGAYAVLAGLIGTLGLVLITISVSFLSFAYCHLVGIPPSAGTEPHTQAEPPQ